jgi:ADP-ribose pyrophosphatase
MHLYLATGIAGTDGDDRLAPDDDERLELRHVALDEALRLVDAGEVCDAKSILGILWLDRLRRSGELAM